MISPDLHAQMLRMLDGELSVGELTALEAEMLENPEARLVWQKLSRLHSALEMRYRSEASLAVLPVVPVDRVLARQRRRNLRNTIFAAAAVLLLMASLLWVHRVSSTPPLASPFRVAPNSVFTLSHPDGNGSDHTLSAGSQVRLDHGVAEVTLPHGVRAVIQGPGTFTLMDARTLNLLEGKGYFEVTTDQGKGFTVTTPHQRVVDLGTRFGVSIRPDHPEVEVHVLEGRVRIDGTDGTAGPVLNSKRAVRLGGTIIREEIPPAAGSFVEQLPPKVETLLTEDFESGLLAGHRYAVRMDRGIVRDLSGNHLPGIHNDETWTFDTANLSPLIVNTSIKSADMGSTREMDPQCAISGKGLAGDTPSLAGQHGTAWLEHWMGPGPDPQITIDLGTSEDLESVHVWNYNESIPEKSLTNRGLNEVAIFVSPNPDEANLVKLVTDGSGQHDDAAGNFRFPEASGADSYEGFTLDLSGVINASVLAEARLVRIQGMSTHGAPVGGLAEIHFGRAPIHSKRLPPSLQTTQQPREEPIPPPSDAEPPVNSSLPDDPIAPFITSLTPFTASHPARPGEGLTAVFSKPVQLGAGRVFIRNLDSWSEEIVLAGEPGLSLKANRMTVKPPSGLMDGESHIADITGWNCNTWIRLFNPRGDGTHYRAEQLTDSGGSRGILGAMKGPAMASLSSARPGSALWRTVAPLQEDCTYAVSLAIGVRDAVTPEPFLGYTIRLSSGGVVLAERSGSSPPGPPNSVTSVGFGWDSSSLPEGVSAGDPLVLEIMPSGTSASQVGYLDLDNLRVSVVEH